MNTNKFDPHFQELLTLAPPSPSKSWWIRTNPNQELANKLNAYYLKFNSHFMSSQKSPADLACLSDLAERIEKKLTPYANTPELTDTINCFCELFTHVRTYNRDPEIMLRTASSNSVSCYVSPRLVIAAPPAFSLKIEREKSRIEEEKEKEAKEREDYLPIVQGILKQVEILSQEKSKDGQDEGMALFFQELWKVLIPSQLKVWGSCLSGLQVAQVAEQALHPDQDHFRHILIYLIGSLSLEEMLNFYTFFPKECLFDLQKVLREPCKVVYLSGIPHITYPHMKNAPQGKIVDETLEIQAWIRKKLEHFLDKCDKSIDAVKEEQTKLETMKVTIEAMRRDDDLLAKILGKIAGAVNTNIAKMKACHAIFWNHSLFDVQFLNGERAAVREATYNLLQKSLTAKAIADPIQAILCDPEESDYEKENDDDYGVGFPINIIFQIGITRIEEMYKVGLLSNIEIDDLDAALGKKKNGPSTPQTQIIYDLVKKNIMLMGLGSRADFRKHCLYSATMLQQFCNDRAALLKAHPFDKKLLEVKQ